MTDKVQKIKEWISKTQDGLMDANGNFGYLEHEGAYHILCNLNAYIDSMQEEPTNDDLEEAANNAVIALVPSFGQKYSDGSYVSSCRDCFKREELLELFKAGAKWQKQQLMAKAIDGVAACATSMEEAPYIRSLDGISYLKGGDKVKLIIIKEE